MADGLEREQIAEIVADGGRVTIARSKYGFVTVVGEWGERRNSIRVDTSEYDWLSRALFSILAWRKEVPAQ